jgi:hypothetical protein
MSMDSNAEMRNLKEFEATFKQAWKAHHFIWANVDAKAKRILAKRYWQGETSMGVYFDFLLDFYARWYKSRKWTCKNPAACVTSMIKLRKGCQAPDL